MFAWHAREPAYSGIPMLHALERDAYDLRLNLSVEQGLDPRIVIIDIDEESLRREGQWPWPRAKIARLVEALYQDYEIDTLGFDIVFAEPETRYTELALDQAYQASSIGTSLDLKRALASYQGDALLAEVLKGKSAVLGYVFESSDEVQSVGTLPEALFTQASIISETQAPKVGRYSANIPRLVAAVPEAGFFTLASVTDIDGIIRKVALLNQYEGKLYPALPLVMAKQFLGAEVEAVLAPVSKEDDYLALEGLNLGFGEIPLDRQAAIFVPYRQARDAYRYIPAWQVLEGSVQNAQALSGTLALLGTSAAGLVDLRNTPLENAFPGVEIHATILSGLLDGQFLSQPDWVRSLDILLIIVFGGLLAILLPLLSITKATILTFTSMAALIAANTYFWLVPSWVVPIAAALVLIALLYALNTMVGFFAESRSKLIMRRMFGLYIPPEIVDEMSATPDVYSLKSQRREMSVLFSDVRGFTTISESLTPEALSELLNTLLTPITEIIHRHQGAIDKYMGDAVMAFWGAPMPTDNHASLAVEAALEMTHKLDEINVDFADRNWPEMRMGIGISTGLMSVGNMGSEFRMAYTVLGDSVNLGSRLEGLTKLYGVDIIVSEATQLAAQ
ncbi:MAG: adenylate/guanylate cyclase domain-containing protein, partial [Arenicellales bacterium]